MSNLYRVKKSANDEHLLAFSNICNAAKYAMENDLKVFDQYNFIVFPKIDSFGIVLRTKKINDDIKIMKGDDIYIFDEINGQYHVIYLGKDFYVDKKYIKKV